MFIWNLNLNGSPIFLFADSGKPTWVPYVTLLQLFRMWGTIVFRFAPQVTFWDKGNFPISNLSHVDLFPVFHLHSNRAILSSLICAHLLQVPERLFENLPCTPGGGHKTILFRNHAPALLAVSMEICKPTLKALLGDDDLLVLLLEFCRGKTTSFYPLGFCGWPKN